MYGYFVQVILYAIFAGKADEVHGRIWITSERKHYFNAKSLCESEPNSEIVELHQAEIIQEFKDYGKFQICTRKRSLMETILSVRFSLPHPLPRNRSRSPISVQTKIEP